VKYELRRLTYPGRKSPKNRPQGEKGVRGFYNLASQTKKEKRKLSKPGKRIEKQVLVREHEESPGQKKKERGVL